MATTQSDIAKRANVSRSLVGHVLSGHPGTWVSPETKQRIIRTARELNYQPNASARMLRRGKSDTVGLFDVRSRDQSRPQLPGIVPVDVCADILSRAGYDLKVKAYPDVDELLLGLREAACGGLCDAFLVSGHYAERQGELLESLGVHFAIYGTFTDTHPGWYQVDYDHAAMMSMAVENLAKHGKVRPSMLCYAHGGYNDRLIAGFQQACKTTYGPAADAEMIVRIAGDWTSTAQFDEEFERWLSRPLDRRPDSIVMAVESPILIHVEEEIWRHGMRVGFGPGNFGMTGACIKAYGWICGDYSAFDHSEDNAIARVMTEDIIVPLLQGSEVEKSPRLVTPKIIECSGRSSRSLSYLAAI